MRTSPVPDARALIQNRLDDERGTLGLGVAAPVVLAYPSPYRVGMSSLGFQTLYRSLNEHGPGCHRAFLPDAWEPMALPWPQPKQAILSYEQRRPISDYGIIGLSVAYELEIVGVIRLLQGAGIPLFAKDRRARDPIIVAGGPITTSNASLLLPYVDVLIAGEAEELLPLAVDRMLQHRAREARLAALEDLPHTTLGNVLVRLDGFRRGVPRGSRVSAGTSARRRSLCEGRYAGDLPHRPTPFQGSCERLPSGSNARSFEAEARTGTSSGMASCDGRGVPLRCERESERGEAALLRKENTKTRRFYPNPRIDHSYEASA